MRLATFLSSFVVATIYFVQSGEIFSAFLFL
nr:MAG TPA: hypothetical protein [Bacteriophage sp.]